MRIGAENEVSAGNVAFLRHELMADAAADIVADDPGGDDPLRGVEGGHAPDRGAVAPMGVRHGQGVADDARQGGDVHHLLGHPLRFDLGDERLGGEDPPGDAHGALSRDLEAEIVDLLDHARPRQGPVPYIPAAPPGQPRGEAGAGGRFWRIFTFVFTFKLTNDFTLILYTNQ